MSRMQRRGQVISAVQSGKRTANEIAEFIGAPLGTVRRELLDLRKIGILCAEASQFGVVTKPRLRYAEVLA